MTTKTTNDAAEPGHTCCPPAALLLSHARDLVAKAVAENPVALPLPPLPEHLPGMPLPELAYLTHVLGRALQALVDRDQFVEAKKASLYLHTVSTVLEMKAGILFKEEDGNGRPVGAATH